MSALSGTPESGEPHEKGTRIWRGEGSCPRIQPPPSPSFRASRAKSHRPLRFFHSARSKSGRGCSGKGIESLRDPCERAVPTAARVAASTATAMRDLDMKFLGGDVVLRYRIAAASCQRRRTSQAGSDLE